MLEFSARDEIAGLDQGLDHGLVGVALVALVVDDAAAGKARRFLGEEAIGIDRIGDARVDAARLKRPRCSPSRCRSRRGHGRRGMHEAGACIVGDMIAVEEGNVEIVAGIVRRKRMRAGRTAQASVGADPSLRT